MAAPAARKPSARTKARKRALDILFEADLRGVGPLEVLQAQTELADPPVREFTAELVRGVVEHAEEIDRIVADCLEQGWTLARMPRVDRNLARLAVFEIRHTGVADQVAVAECVSLGAELSTDASPGFLNGLLSAVVARTGKPD